MIDDAALAVIRDGYCNNISLNQIHDEQFVAALKDQHDYHQFTIVGNRYRSPEAQQVLGFKRTGTLVLLVREPGNPYDANAIACLVTASVETGEDYKWIHVGYLPKNTAEVLAPIWPERMGHPVIMHASLKHSAQARSRRGIVHLDYINEQYGEFPRGRCL